MLLLTTNYFLMKFLTFAAFFLSFSLFAQTSLPTISIKTLEGTQTSLQQLSEDNDLMIVSLWATWCVPCKNELDAINDVYQDWQDETNVKLYAISIDDSRTVKRVKPLVNGKGWEFDVLLDTNNDLKRALGTATVPYTIVISKGKVIYKHSGYTPGAEDELYEILKDNS